MKFYSWWWFLGLLLIFFPRSLPSFVSTEDGKPADLMAVSSAGAALFFQLLFHDTWRSSLKCLHSIMILLFLKHSPRLYHIQGSHLQLLWNCIVDQNIWGNHWEVSIILKIGMVSESVSWPLIWYLKRSLACGNSRHTIFSLLLNTMNMTTLKIHRVISLGHRLIFLTETV